MDDTGWLRVSVTEANGTIPVRGAFVTLTEYGPGMEGDVIRILTTGPDGLTETVRLPVPPASESMTPGGEYPGGLYGVTVWADGYYPAEAVGAPVFGGVVSLQNIDLIPIGAYAGEFASGQYVIYETPETFPLMQDGAGREDIGDRNGIVSGGVVHKGRKTRDGGGGEA